MYLKNLSSFPFFPSDGDDGIPGAIPPKSVLLFDVQLVDIAERPSLMKSLPGFLRASWPLVFLIAVASYIARGLKKAESMEKKKKKKS